MTDEDKIIGVLPAGGWRVSHADSNDEPVVGWVVYAGGRAEALVHEGRGIAVAAADFSQATLYHVRASDAHLVRQGHDG